MERILFERPREKLQAKGVAYLSTIELLQVIIGSGNARASAARLAKRISYAISKGELTMRTLLAIEGIGVARACQLLAALELGKRISDHSLKSIISADRITNALSRQRQKVLIVYMFDGAGVELSEKVYNLTHKTSRPAMMRQVCEDAVTLSARTAVLAIGCANGSDQADMDEMHVIKSVKDALGTLGVNLSGAYIGNKTFAHQWKGA